MSILTKKQRVCGNNGRIRRKNRQEDCTGKPILLCYKDRNMYGILKMEYPNEKNRQEKNDADHRKIKKRNTGGAGGNTADVADFLKGTENRSARQIAEEMDALGGQINAYTTKEYTCYHTRVLDKHVKQAMEVMSDMLLHPAFSQEEVDKERNVITEEIYMYDDAPEELVHDCLQDSIWRESSLGMPILGTEETIGNLDAEKIRAYYEKNYHTENMVLSVAGNFKREEMLELLNHYFGRWQAKAPYAPLETKASYHQSWIQKKKRCGTAPYMHCF